MSRPRRPLQDQALRGTYGWPDFDGDLLDPTRLGPGTGARARAEKAGSISLDPESSSDPDMGLESDLDLGAASAGDLDTESPDDFDVGATFSRAGLLRPSGLGNRRRTHALSAAGAGLAVAFALAIHAATERPPFRSGPVGAGTFAHVAPIVRTQHHARRTHLPDSTGVGRREGSASARVAAARLTAHAAPAAHAVLAPPPRTTGAPSPAAEFGFER
jgi:hypothetical protein